MHNGGEPVAGIQETPGYYARFNLLEGSGIFADPDRGDFSLLPASPVAVGGRYGLPVGPGAVIVAGRR
jgi:hypothetical protein